MCSTPLWMRIYVSIIIILIPTVVCAIMNTTIFRAVQLSVRRTQPMLHERTTYALEQRPIRLTRQEGRFLRHMIIMTLVFIVGWAPIYICWVLLDQMTIHPNVLALFSLLADSSLLLNIIDLFLCSHKLLLYLRETCCW
jgi:hypothetical protein